VKPKKTKLKIKPTKIKQPPKQRSNIEKNIKKGHKKGIKEQLGRCKNDIEKQPPSVHEPIAFVFNGGYEFVKN